MIYKDYKEIGLRVRTDVQSVNFLQLMECIGGLP